MARHAGQLTVAVRALQALCRRQRKYLVILACVSLLACFHFLAGSSGLFSAELGRRGPAADRGENSVVVHEDDRRLSELGGVVPWPPPPSPQQVAEVSEFPFKPSKSLQRDIRVQEGINGRAVAGARSVAKTLTTGHPWWKTPVAKGRIAPFPWPVRQNVIPNYFLNYGNASLSSPASGKLARLHAGDVLVFLHHNKAAGTTTKQCLTTLRGADLGRSLGPVLSSGGRLAVEARFARNKRFMLRSSPNTYFGGYSFGMCDLYKKPCAYFTVMRDPYERTLSSHSYCKHARHDQLCTAQVAGRVSLREWAIHQGSFFFRQLLFQPEFCSDKTRWVRHIEIDDVPHEFLKNRDFLNGAPCWFREKLIMELTLDQTEHDALLQYCLANMERWFTVIMLVDRYNESLQMAQEAFKLPMYDLCAGRHVNSGSYNKTAKPVTYPRDIPNRTSSTDHSKRDDFSAQAQLRELRQDPEVRRILRADELLYQKGVEIFNKQWEIFNRIRS